MKFQKNKAFIHEHFLMPFTDSTQPPKHLSIHRKTAFIHLKAIYRSLLAV